jgi:hypothetical protein
MTKPHLSYNEQDKSTHKEETLLTPMVTMVVMRTGTGELKEERIPLHTDLASERGSRRACRIPMALEKPPKLETYDGIADPDEHFEHIDTVLDYHQVCGPVKCKLFLLTLKGSDMTWFKGLKDDLIDSSPKYRYDQSNHTGRSLYYERRVHYRIAISRYCNSKCTWFKILCTNGSKYVQK